VSLREAAFLANLGCNPPSYVVGGTDPSAIGRLVGEAERWTGKAIEVQQVYQGRPRLFTIKSKNGSQLIVFHFGYVNITLILRNILAGAVLSGDISGVGPPTKQLCYRLLADDAVVDGNIERAIHLFCAAKTEFPLSPFNPGTFLDFAAAPLQEASLCPWMFGLAHEFGHHAHAGFKAALMPYLPTIATICAKKLANTYAGGSDPQQEIADCLVRDTNFDLIAEEHIADTCAALITWNACNELMIERVKRTASPEIFALEVLLAHAVLMTSVHMRQAQQQQNLLEISFGLGLRELLIRFSLIDGMGPLKDVMEKSGQHLPSFSTPGVQELGSRLLTAATGTCEAARHAREEIEPLVRQMPVDQRVDQFVHWRSQLATPAERDTVDLDTYHFVRLAKQLGRFSPEVGKLWDVSTRGRPSPIIEVDNIQYRDLSPEEADRLFETAYERSLPIKILPPPTNT
jgi:hypothetical protein